MIFQHEIVGLISIECAFYHDDQKLCSTDLSKVGTSGPLQIFHADLIPEMAPFREALSKAFTRKGNASNEDVYPGTMSGLFHCLDTVYCTKECAKGASKSLFPKVYSSLQSFSSFGPAVELKKLAIPVIVDTPERLP